MAKETNHLQIAHAFAPEAFIGHMMDDESVGAQAFFAVQRAVVGDSEPKFFPPLHELPVRGPKIDMAIPPLPVDPLNKAADEMKNKPNHQTKHGQTQDVTQSPLPQVLQFWKNQRCPIQHNPCAIMLLPAEHNVHR